MNIQDKTKEEFQKELSELQKEYNLLKDLYDKGDSDRRYSFDEMRETNLKLTLAMQGGNMAWWQMDVPTGNVTFGNHKVEMLGYLSENFTHYKDFTALVHPNDYERIMNAMKGHLDGTLEKYEATYRIMANSGEYTWFYDYGSVVKKDPDGKPLIVFGFVFNITDKKKAEESFHLISRAVESTSDAIGISDATGHHFYQNKALSDLFGYETAKETEAAGGGMARVKDPAVAKQMFHTILDGKSWSGELEMVTKSGRVFPAYERADAIKDEEGNTIGVIGIITDITEGRQAEEILLKSENMLQTVLDNFPGVVFWKDRQSDYLGCNQAFASGAGVKNPAEIVGKTDLEMPWASTEAINYLNDDKAVMESGKGRMNIIESQHQSDGSVIWLDTSKFPLLDSSGQVIGVIGVSNDISTLRMAEQNLLNTNKELVFQNEEKAKRAAELIIANKELAYQNREKEKRGDELIIANKELLFQNEEKEKRAAELIVANKELVFQNEEKVKRAAELIIANKELALQNREKEKRADELILANKELVYQNEEKEKRASELIAANKELAFQNEEKAKRAAELIIANKELAHQHREKEKRADELILANKELVYQNEEKENRAYELIVANEELAFQNGEKEKRAAELIVANKELLYQNKEKENRADELIIANKELVYQNEEKERRAEELINARNKAEASDRLKTAFMNNISHEIRTPLNGILGFAPFVIQPDITMEEKEEYVEILNFSSNRLMNTITDIMDISLLTSGNMEVHAQPVSISSLLTNVFEDFQKPAKATNLELKMQFPSDADQVILITDGEMLRKTVSKLVDNSVKFTKEGSVTLGFELTNNQIEIFVIDTGTGIEKDAQERIYKYFVQEDISNTRGHEGSGLGLSIAKGMILLLGGEIRLESIKNVGTTVFLTLPALTSTASSKPENETNAIKGEGMPIILVAEDDDSSYFYIETLLGKDRKILRACNGLEAVDLCRKHPDIHLVLMDIKMPDMNGLEATHSIKSFRHDIPIIALTAFAQSGDEYKIKEAGCDDYLSKPINKTELFSLIHKYTEKN